MTRSGRIREQFASNSACVHWDGGSIGGNLDVFLEHSRSQARAKEEGSLPCDLSLKNDGAESEDSLSYVRSLFGLLCIILLQRQFSSFTWCMYHAEFSR